MPASFASYVQPAPAAVAEVAAAADLRREVFGFLPYWSLSGAATSLDYNVLSTIAYFSVGADSLGNLKKRNSDGTLTTGWGGWTSSSLTSVINAAHSKGTRVVLTVSVFGWTSSSAAVQKALLSDATARANLAAQIAGAVVDRGADGVNLDFEPLVSGQEANFVALLKSIRAEFNKVRTGYQITYDTLGFIGNYPLEASLGASAADAVFIMGYDYRTDSASTSGSIDPLSGPTYDLADTVRAYTARISPSQVILGVPWYGRAWSTTSSSPRSTNQSGLKYGYSTAVTYENIPSLVAQYGSKWDALEQSPYIVYQRQNCTSTYGCVTSWRQVWYDDETSLGLRYQLANDYKLRGAGMWALGYEGASPDMNRALATAFRGPGAVPVAGINALSINSLDEGVVVRWSGYAVSAIKAYDVQVATDGGAWTAWLTATTATSSVWLGQNDHDYAFRVRATDTAGNVGGWTVTTAEADTPSSLSVGGFGRTTIDDLSYRSGPGTSTQRLGALPLGTVVALTDGPISANGYTWYEVTEPIVEWDPVSHVERGVWIAVSSTSATFVKPFHAPNSTHIRAGIANLDFAGGDATGSTAAAALARTFSPNGDGTRDTMTLRWTNMVAMDAMELNVLGLDGTVLGTVQVPATSAANHVWAWNGAVGGTTLADGRYLLQLTGQAGTIGYHAPSALPATGPQIAAFAVTVDTVAPVVSSATSSALLISPNGDDRLETASFSASSPSATSWSLTVKSAAGTTVRSASGAGATVAFIWDGRTDAGATVADGVYTVTLAACDLVGNCSGRDFAVTVDTTAPTVALAPSPVSFSPNADGANDTSSLGWTASERSSGTVSVYKGSTLIRRWSVAAALAGSVAWNGRNTAGSGVADGRYTVKTELRDAAGNARTSAAFVTVDRTAGFLRWSKSFYPGDADALAPTSTLSYTLVRSAATTLAIYDASGALVRHVWANRAQTAAKRSWTWNGKLDDGTYAPQGVYTARLTVVSAYSTQTIGRGVVAAAFITKLSATTVRAGQTLTVNFRTVEGLRTTPKVTFRQPGVSPVVVWARRLADGSYRAVFKVTGTTAGTATIRILATDTGGRINTTVYLLALAK